MGGYKCLRSLVVVLALTMSLAEAQSGTTTCAQDLIPCADYLNATTTPPSLCCDPLKRTVENELTCLCNLFYTPGLLQSFNISIDNALALSRRCGVTSDLTSCNNGAPSPGSSAPPATTGGDKGGAGKVTFSGISFLLLFWVSMVFN
ncbi:hypothetical protein VNO80_21202 [Phaseolus coccineus]|uniref:Bifunctional inhibitor/plant lipid transfer protein/seed storage helical domain-containing protein n=1 Tax=Phaseolus coccineus TaxID=3886 RepID=A0AAN9M2T2_PHACN